MANCFMLRESIRMFAFHFGKSTEFILRDPDSGLSVRVNFLDSGANSST